MLQSLQPDTTGGLGGSLHSYEDDAHGTGVAPMEEIKE
jgi:hypothetical protein